MLHVKFGSLVAREPLSMCLHRVTLSRWYRTPQQFAFEMSRGVPDAVSRSL